ncbi:hypothetical protein HELRODRAFT_167826 [Helobdella robusta]|uniref:Uncharacterized protein n=1 Tax=Helobdella robusta TaxID=6412 RepID=T1EZU5_HELRO|nr:hypothetical protein HELRODRAFT_167826 [Helobdella robusta]ESO09991.1 hypothetical protein HELRODRAFT_167826 [Helobdella robusta]
MEENLTTVIKRVYQKMRSAINKRSKVQQDNADKVDQKIRKEEISHSNQNIGIKSEKMKPSKLKLYNSLRRESYLIAMTSMNVNADHHNSETPNCCNVNADHHNSETPNCCNVKFLNSKLEKSISTIDLSHYKNDQKKHTNIIKVDFEARKNRSLRLKSMAQTLSSIAEETSFNLHQIELDDCNDYKMFVKDNMNNINVTNNNLPKSTFNLVLDGRNPVRHSDDNKNLCGTSASFCSLASTFSSSTTPNYNETFCGSEDYCDMNATTDSSNSVFWLNSMNCSNCCTSENFRQEGTLEECVEYEDEVDELVLRNFMVKKLCESCGNSFTFMRILAYL